MKRLSYKVSNKGVSEMVSYVLLIVIAVSISVLVYSYLKAYIPKDTASCPENINLIIQDYSCTPGNTGSLSLTLVNKGLFNVSAAYVRFGPTERKVKSLITNLTVFFPYPLSPGEFITQGYSLEGLAPSSGEYGLEVEPAVLSGKNNKELALCEKAVIVQKIECNSP